MQQRRSSYKSSFAQLLRCALCYAALVGRLLSYTRSCSFAFSQSVSQSAFLFGGCFTFGFLLILDDASAPLPFWQLLFDVISCTQLATTKLQLWVKLSLQLLDKTFLDCRHKKQLETHAHAHVHTQLKSHRRSLARSTLSVALSLSLAAAVRL